MSLLGIGYQKRVSLRLTLEMSTGKMTAVVRDASWNAFYRECKPLWGTEAEKMADSMYRFQVRIREEHLKIPRVTVLKKAPPASQEKKKMVSFARCQAINLNNKPCQYKATCGNFCSKHKIEEVPTSKKLIVFLEEED